MRIITQVWTDGFGSFQARCSECAWCSRWFERGSKEKREAEALIAAKQHGEEHAFADEHES